MHLGVTLSGSGTSSVVGARKRSCGRGVTTASLTVMLVMLRVDTTMHGTEFETAFHSDIMWEKAEVVSLGLKYMSRLRER